MNDPRRRDYGRNGDESMEMSKAILSTYDDDGFLNVQPDYEGTGPEQQVYHALGFDARPMDPSEDGACVIRHETQGMQSWVTLHDDSRVTPKLENLQLGESRFYGPKTQSYAKWKSSGDWEIKAQGSGGTTAAAVTIDASMVTIGKSDPQFVALENLVRAELGKIKNYLDELKSVMLSHQHLSAAAGSPTTPIVPPAFVVSSTYTVGNVASQKLKTD